MNTTTFFPTRTDRTDKPFPTIEDRFNEDIIKYGKDIALKNKETRIWAVQQLGIRIERLRNYK